MIRDILALALFALAALGLVYAAGFVVAARFTTSAAIRLSAGLVALGSASCAVLITTYFDGDAGRVLSVAIVIASLIALAIGRSWRHWREALNASALLVGLMLATLSFGLLWVVGQDPFADAAHRFLSWQLPPDNVIPALLAGWFDGARSQPFLLGDWLPSDRPPLQTGMLLYFRDVAELLVPAARAADVLFAASVAVQFTWIPAAFALLSALGYKRWASMNAIVCASFVPVTFVNVIYTWPKLLAGSMIVASLAVLVSDVRGQTSPARGLPIAAALAVLGLLAHGGAAFVLPAILGLAALIIYRAGARIGVLVSAICASVVVVMYTPWLLFQRLVAPPGDRLLKWHLAGVVSIDDRTFAAALRDQYAGMSWSEFLHARYSNLVRAFDLRLAQGLDFWNPDWTQRRAASEFTEIPIALGIAALLVVVLLVVRGVQKSRGAVDETTAWSARIVLAMLACIAAWALIMFIPASAFVHQGSHAWMIVLLIVPIAWIVRARWWTGPVLIAIQLCYAIVVYTASPLATTPIHRSAAILGLVGIVLVGATLFHNRPVAIATSSEATLER